MEHDARPTTALNSDELSALVAKARDAKAALAVEVGPPRMTDGIAPIVIIVDRPARVIDGLVQDPKRRSRVMDAARFSARSSMPPDDAAPVAVAVEATARVARGTRPFRLPTSPLGVRAGGVAVASRGIDPYMVALVVAVLLATAWVVLSLH